MAFDTARLAAQAASLTGLLPITFTYAGKSYTGFKYTGRHQHEHTEYGEEPVYDLSIGTLISSFTTPPEPDEQITYAGTVYRILNTETDSGDVQIVMHCGYLYASK